MPFLAVLVLAAVVPSAVRTATYREVTEGQRSTHAFRITEVAGGHLVEVTRSGGDFSSTERFVLDPDWSTVRWTHTDDRRNTRIEARREGKRIRLKGTCEGEAVDEDYDAGTQPWHQVFPIDLEPFVASGQQQFRYWAIGLTGTSKLRIATFEARRDGPVKLGKADAIHVTISLTGLLRPFWSGAYWFVEGEWVRFEGRNAFGPSVTTRESQGSPPAERPAEGPSREPAAKVVPSLGPQEATP